MITDLPLFSKFHTLVSVLAIVFGAAALVRERRIDPGKRIGKLYLAAMFIGSITAFGFIPDRGFTPGQVLTLVTLGLLFSGIFAVRDGYRQTISFTASFLLLMVFATTETLTRIPVGNPFAIGPNDPALLPIRLALLAGFTLLTAIHLRRIRRKRTMTPPSAPPSPSLLVPVA